MSIFILTNQAKDMGLLVGVLNALHEEIQILKHELLCRQLDKAPTEPINCRCNIGDLKDE